MSRTRIKICGITNAHDAETAIRAGADALGFMMYEDSPRFIDPVIAMDILQRIPPFVSCVGVFVNPSRDQVIELCRDLPFDVLQFHGDEDEDFCSRFSKPYVKAIRVSEGLDLAQTIARFPRARAILLDSQVAGMYGGSGSKFDWQLATAPLQKPVILAGGLNAANVAEAIRLVKPFAVDISSGVEKHKGIKDVDKVHEFIAAVKSCDNAAVLSDS